MQESIFTMALNPFFWKGMEYKKVLNIQDETENGVYLTSTSMGNVRIFLRNNNNLDSITSQQSDDVCDKK